MNFRLLVYISRLYVHVSRTYVPCSLQRSVRPSHIHIALSRQTRKEGIGTYLIDLILRVSAHNCRLPTGAMDINSKSKSIEKQSVIQ